MSSSVTTQVGGGGKTSWPEVVGLSVQEAKKVILEDKLDANIVVLPTVTLTLAVTSDFAFNRVRVFVGTVAQTPHVG